MLKLFIFEFKKYYKQWRDISKKKIHLKFVEKFSIQLKTFHNSFF